MNKPAQIEGIKMKLVTIEESDAQDMIALRNNPDLNKFLSNSGQTIDLEHQLHWMRRVMPATDCIDFKIVDKSTHAFCGTIALYDIENGSAEFGRYIASNAIAALESEYLILKFGFEVLNLRRIYCNTVKANTKVWQQHTKFGFLQTGEDFDDRIQMQRVCQEISREDFAAFNYDPILNIIRRF